jgi:PAS domain S-box-containing protein
MLKLIAKSLRSINPWHFLWISVLLSELLTFLSNSFQGYVLWGFVPHEIIVVGAVDALLVSIVVAAIVIYFVTRAKEIESANDQLMREIKERRRAEEELRREKIFTENALNVLQEIFFVIGTDGRFLRWNKTVKTVTGYNDEEISLMKPTDFFPEEERQRASEAIATAMEEGHVNLETVILTKDGRRIPFMFTGSILMNRDGGTTGISGTGTDISKRRRAEALLQESEAKFRDMAEKSVVGIYLIQDEIFRYVNPRLAEIFGYKAEELIDKKGPEDLVLPEDWPIVSEKLRKRISGKMISTHYSFQGIRKDGTIIHVEIHGSRTTFKASPAVIGTLLDVTESRRAGEALKESEEKYRNLIETAHDLIWSVNAEGRITFINEAAHRLYGYSPEELIGKSFADVISPEHAKSDLDLFRQFAAHDEGTVNYETTLIKRDGTPVVLSTNTVVLRDDKGKVLGVMATSKDITAYRQAVEALKASSTRLRNLSLKLSLIEELERRKIAAELHDQIGQNLALAKIKLGELRASPALPDEIVNSASFVRELIDTSIQYTRSLTAELSSPLLYELGLEAAVQALAEQVQVKYGLRIDFQKEGDSEPLAEKILIVLYKSLRELLVNVIKHARADRVTVSVRSCETDIKVAVEDNGIGFDVSKLDAPGNETRFGLFNIRERVESIGGQFAIESQPARGTRVFLVVPL